MAERYELDPGEQVIERVNPSIYQLLPVLFSSGMIVIFTLAGLIGYIVFHAQLSFLPASFVMALVLVLLIVAVGVGFTGYYVYNHNYLLITTVHVIKVEQVGLFNEKTAQLDLARMQDVTGSKHGIAQTVLDFGDIEIETAGAQENFIFRNVSGPQMLADRLLKLHQEYMERAAGGQTPTAAPAAQAAVAAPTTVGQTVATQQPASGDDLPDAFPPPNPVGQSSAGPQPPTQSSAPQMPGWPAGFQAPTDLRLPGSQPGSPGEVPAAEALAPAPQAQPTPVPDEQPPMRAD